MILLINFTGIHPHYFSLACGALLKRCVSPIENMFSLRKHGDMIGCSVVIPLPFICAILYNCLLTTLELNNI